MNILPVFGTRPAAIKLTPVVKFAPQNPAFDARGWVITKHR